MLLVGGKLGSSRYKACIVGVGNEIAGDDGFGLEVIRGLRGKVPDSVFLLEAGTSPQSIFFVPPCERLYVIDAVFGGGEPGDIYILRPEDTDGRFIFSSHDIGFIHGLFYLLLTGHVLDAVIIGIEPNDFSCGGISEELRGKVGEVIDFILKEIGGEDAEVKAETV